MARLPVNGNHKSLNKYKLMKYVWKKTVIAMKSRLNPLERLDIRKWLKIALRSAFTLKKPKPEVEMMH